MDVKQLKDKSGTNIQPNSPDKVGYPSRGETTGTYEANTTYTASEDGYVELEYQFYLNGATQDSCEVVIDNVATRWFLIQSASGVFGGYFSVPIMKGQTFRCDKGSYAIFSQFNIRFRKLISGGGD